MDGGIQLRKYNFLGKGMISLTNGPSSTRQVFGSHETTCISSIKTMTTPLILGPFGTMPKKR